MVPTRTLYLVRHGEADALGNLTEVGALQSTAAGSRLAGLPVDAVWHSPLPRAAESARALAAQLPGAYLDEAAELVDHVPFVPDRSDIWPAWRGFFDGYDHEEAVTGHAAADALTARFAHPHGAGRQPTHEVLVTHAYPIAWLVRDALAAPHAQWMALSGVANASLTVLEFTDAAPPTVIIFNDQAHLPRELAWTGFPGRRP